MENKKMIEKFLNESGFIGHLTVLLNEARRDERRKIESEDQPNNII